MPQGKLYLFPALIPPLLLAINRNEFGSKQNTVSDKLLRMEYFNYISSIFSHLTKSSSHPKSWFVIARDIIPRIVAVDNIVAVHKGAVLSRSPNIVWFTRMPVGEDDTFAI